MALTASAITPSSCPMTLLRRLPCQLHRPLVGHVWFCPISASNSVKSSRMEQFNEPPKLKMQVNYAIQTLREFIPDSIQNFPWAKAQSAAKQQLVALGKEALKWSLTALCILSSVSDIIYSISRNKELLIPFGLLSGCLIADFLKETSQEYFHYSQEIGKNWHLFGIACFFILVKIIAVYFPVEQQAFLLHGSNGGLMQVLWQWNSSSQHEGDNRENVALEDASSTANAEIRSD